VAGLMMSRVLPSAASTCVPSMKFWNFFMEFFYHERPQHRFSRIACHPRHGVAHRQAPQSGPPRRCSRTVA
jgi:hypothetical protein